MMRKIALSLLIVWPVVCGAQQPAVLDKKKLEMALTRVEAALKGQELHGDVAFLLGQVEKWSGHRVDIRLPGYVEAKKDIYPVSLEYYLWTIRHEAIALPQSPKPRTSGHGTSTSAGSPAKAARDNMRWSQDFDRAYHQMGKRVMQIMSDAITCEPLGKDGKPRKGRDLVGLPDQGYVLTHQAIGLLIARFRKCFSTDSDMELEAYTRRIHDEFIVNLDILSDLQAERALTLILTGQKHLIPAEFANRLVRSQRPDGTWAFDEPVITQGLMLPEHTTGLVFAVLAAFAGDI